jgi:hypothetical protein
LKWWTAPAPNDDRANIKDGIRPRLCPTPPSG